MKSKMADQWAKANDRYPTSEALRRLATKKPQAGKGKEKSGKSNAKEKEIQEQDHQKDQVQDQLNHQQQASVASSPPKRTGPTQQTSKQHRPIQVSNAEAFSKKEPQSATNR